MKLLLITTFLTVIFSFSPTDKFIKEGRPEAGLLLQRPPTPGQPEAEINPYFGSFKNYPKPPEPIASTQFYGYEPLSYEKYTAGVNFANLSGNIHTEVPSGLNVAPSYGLYNSPYFGYRKASSQPSAIKDMSRFKPIYDMVNKLKQEVFGTDQIVMSYYRFDHLKVQKNSLPNDLKISKILMYEKLLKNYEDNIAK